jgi:hypothetical protein
LTEAVTVTVCAFWIVIAPLVEVGVVRAATQFVPSVDVSQVAAAFQLPEALLRNCSNAGVTVTEAEKLSMPSP